MKILFIVLCFLFQFAAANIAAQQSVSPAEPRIEGVARDENGAIVSNVEITFSSQKPEFKLQTRTDENGRFIFNAVKTRTGKLTIKAAGFESLERDWNADADFLPLEITLKPIGIAEVITITGAQTRLEETPASVVAINRTSLETTAAASLDDKLRQVPGFSLFRRASSRTANPTAQGVSLRGIGASGASRALVLVDGVPLNDAFGGWIYWGRVPGESISKVEILRGAASDLYGGGALGGVVSIVTRKPEEKPILNFEASYGNQNTPNVSAFASAGIGNWLASASAEVFRTDGYIIVDENERGIVDTPANVSRAAANMRLERSFAERGRIFASAEYYGEKRNNGTPQQTNDTRLRQIVAGGDFNARKFGAFAGRIYGSAQTYHQSFSAVGADRDSESLTRLQSVPSQVFGFNGKWSQTFAAENTLVAGIDWREVRGRSDEIGFNNNRATSAVSAGGRELTFGIFAADIWRVNSRLTLSGGLRYDRWRNYAASSTIISLTQNSPPIAAIFPKRIDFAISPRASLLYRLNKNISLAASVARAFRQPTLNELYRSFRLGNVQTLANENLRAESATNGEAGIVAAAFNNRLYVRSNVFLTEISQPVANVTINATPALITRQRQNLGRTRSRGLEIDAEMRVRKDFSLSSGYLFVDARVVSFSANPALENLFLPQVGRHQFTVQTQYQNQKIARVGLQARALSNQFEDDQNRLRLNSYFTLDAFVSRRLNKYFEAFAAAENLFDNRIETGRTPIVTLGSPLNFRVGLRLRFGAN